MITIAVTGGVACGKSMVCEKIQELAPGEMVKRFDSDACVTELFEDKAVRARIREIDDSAGLVSKSGVNKALLRQRVFDNSSIREKLEAILHPLVLERARAFADAHSRKTRLLLLEVPLLYEVDFPVERNIDLVVAASTPTQMKRLFRERGVEADLAKRIIDSQLPIDEKIERADVVIWNDGSLDSLQSQVAHLVKRCETLFT